MLHKTCVFQSFKKSILLPNYIFWSWIVLSLQHFIMIDLHVDFMVWVQCANVNDKKISQLTVMLFARDVLSIDNELWGSMWRPEITKWQRNLNVNCTRWSVLVINLLRNVNLVKLLRGNESNVLHIPNGCFSDMDTEKHGMDLIHFL